MCAWLKFELRPSKQVIHPRVMFHLAPHSSLNTSTSSLSPTSPVLLSSSSPDPDLLSTHPFTHCEDPRRDGTSTEFHCSTNRTLCKKKNKHNSEEQEKYFRSCQPEGALRDTISNNTHNYKVTSYRRIIFGHISWRGTLCKVVNRTVVSLKRKKPNELSSNISRIQ